MPFVVTQKDGTEVTISENDLVNTLMSKILEEENLQEIVPVTNAFTENVSTEIVKVPLNELILLSFRLGYYFRIFKNKNSVTFIEDKNV